MKRLVGWALALGCIMVVSSTVRADISLVDASGLEYFVQTSTSETSSSASGAASDATYTAAVPSTTSGGGTTTTTLSDAFDGYGALLVNGTYFTDNGPGMLGCNDREISFGTQTIGDLEVTRRAFVPDDDEFLRWLNIVKNVGSAPVDVTVSTDNNLGSDSSTQIVATSRNDFIQDVDDLWIATGGDFADPRLGHVLQGAGAPVGLVSIGGFDSNDPECTYDTFSLPAGETAILMFVVTGQPTNVAAAEQAAAISGLGGSMLDCMTNEEAAMIKNFVVDRCDVPGDCDDGDVCNGTETCQNNLCVAGDPLVCPGGETCDPVTGCPGGAGGAGGSAGAGGAGGSGGSGGGGGGGGCAVGANGESPATGILFLTALGLFAIRRRRRI